MECAEAEAIYEQGREAVVSVLLVLSEQNERLAAQVGQLTARVVRQDEDNLDRSFFSPAFELATDAEQRYLIAIANLGDGPYRSAAPPTAPTPRAMPASEERRSCAKR